MIKTAKDDEALDLRGLFAVAARRTQPLMGAVAGEREINDRVQNIVLIVKFAGTKCACKCFGHYPASDLAESESLSFSCFKALFKFALFFTTPFPYPLA